MKNEMGVKEIIITTVSLFLICAVCAGLLALTNNLTKDAIAQRAIEAADSAKKSAVPDAASFSEALIATIDGTEHEYFEALDASGAKIAYVFIASSKGYGGDITVMVGIDTQGFITGVMPTVLNETPGLGMKAQTPEFLDQYISKTEGVAVNKNAPGDNEIKAITGATITSKGVTAAVNTAFEVFNTVKEGGNNG